MRYLLIIFLFISSLLPAQVTENFSDGDFTSNPVWSGDNADFAVVSGQLRSNSNTANYGFYLSTPSAVATNAQWEFYVNLQFLTSSANYVDVYLISDSANLQSTSHSGYFVRIGNTNDEISLYKRTSGTNIEIIDGADGQVGTSNNVMRIKVTRNASNLWTLERDMTGTGGSYATEGTATDAALTTSSYMGIFVQQSATSFHLKHFFDNIYAGAIVVDTTPPTVLSSTVITSTQLDVLFSESVDLASSQTLSNYSADNGIGNPASAIRDASNLSLVHLTFATSFSNAINNTLTVINVQDLSANALTSQTSSFTYFAPVTSVYKDVIITEIFADPSPQVGLPPTEFVEIFNRSANTFNLSGWKFTDGSSTATLGNFNLLPGQYLILCPLADTASYSVFGTVMGMSSFPSLNNTNDNLYLKDNALTIIDSVNYTDSWYQDAVKKDGGWTLELINPSNPAGCAQSGNWISSADTDGGTPGAQNSVFSSASDITAPAISFASVVDSTHVSVCFSEPVDVTQISNPGNYNITGSIGTPVSATANSLFNCVDLTLGSPLNTSATYTLTVSNVSDCSGNALNPSTTTFDFYTAKPFDIVINEIMADPDPALGLPAIQYEYVELHNRTPFQISLHNWTYTAGSTTKTLPNVNIAGNGYIILSTTTNAPLFPPSANAIGVTSFPGLTNTGQSLTLRTPTGLVISNVTYIDSWYQDAAKEDGGWSLEQIDPANPCEGMNNWKASLSPNGGTPGMQNSVNASNPDNTSPSLVRVSIITPDTIQLYFNEQLDSLEMTSTFLYTIDNSIGTPVNVKPLGPEFKSVKLALGTLLSQGIIYKVTVNNSITDCAGNTVGASNSARFALPEPVLANDVVINEVLFDPKTGGVDFVEIYNRSAKVIELGTMTLSQYDTVNNIPLFAEPVAPEGYLLFPGDYLVLSENGNAVKSQYSTLHAEAFLDMDNVPTMSISGGTVCLASGFLVVDHFIYYDYMQFPLLNVTKGVSLERVDFNRETNDITNWHSAAEAVGFATPGYKNSQYNDAEETDNIIEVSPEIFSPDEDGLNDVVSIAYNFKTPGFVANVSIYDSKGRLVRNLVRNELLGVKGAFSWDGINEEREKARIGIYIIFTEVFDISGNVKHYKNTCVLAGKLNE